MVISAKLQYRTNDLQSFFQTRAYKAEHEKIVGNIFETLRLLEIPMQAQKPASGLSHRASAYAGHSCCVGSKCTDAASR